MRLSLIVAVGTSGVIGNEGGLPWRLPSDLAHFKKTTMGHSVVMGRKTFDSIGKPLPGRRNLVLSRSTAQFPSGVEGVRSPEEVLELCAGDEEVFVIGGAEIYRHFIDRADRIFLTEVQGDFPGDTFFDPLDPERWNETSRLEQPVDEKNLYRHTFLLFERRENSTNP